MAHVYESKEMRHGFRVEVLQDECAESPREWDNVGTIVIGDRVRYNVGDRAAPVAQIDALCKDPQNIWLPVYMLDHSGIRLNTSPFGCPWDSGQVGIIYTTKARAVAEWGGKVCTAKVRAAALACLRSEVATLDQFVAGDVYFYRVQDAEGDTVDACHGYYGTADALAAGIEAAEYHVAAVDGFHALQAEKEAARFNAAITAQLQARGIPAQWAADHLIVRSV